MRDVPCCCRYHQVVDQRLYASGEVGDLASTNPRLFDIVVEIGRFFGFLDFGRKGMNLVEP